MIDYYFNWYEGQIWADIFGAIIVAVPAYIFGQFIQRRKDQ